MRLALVGTGQMGTAVEDLAREQGHEIVAWFNAVRPFMEAEGPSALQGADVVVEFSLPHTAVAHIERCCRWGVPIVVGTTGWYDELPLVRQWVARYNAAVLYASNFSLGIALVTHVIRQLLPVLEALPEYDVSLHEVHHLRKADSPSGTALTLAQLLLDGLSRKTHLETETQHHQIDPMALHVTATRLGNVFGTHSLYLDSLFDQISLTHNAKNRQGFAAGALRAAAWLQGRTGLFTLDDLFTEWLTHPPNVERLTPT